MHHVTSFSIPPVHSDPIAAGRILASWLVALLSAISMSVCSTTLAATPSDHTPTSLESLIQIEIQSEKLGCRAARSIQGDVASLDEMNQAVRIIKRETTSLDADRQEGQILWATQSSWIALSKDIQLVGKAMETILRIEDLASDSKAQLHISFFALVDIATNVATTSNDAKRVFHLMNAALVLERMSAKISQFVSNADETQMAADSLSRDMKFMEATISALHDGNSKLEISAESNVAMRARLDEARMPMNSAFTSIRALLAERQTILELSETSPRIAETAAALALQARNARIRATH